MTATAETETGGRLPERLATGAFRLTALVTALLVIAYAMFYPLDRPELSNLVLGTSTLTFYALYTKTRLEDGLNTKSKMFGAAAMLTGLVFLGATFYVHFVYDRWISTGSLLVYNSTDILVGTILVVVTTHVVYEEYGGVLAAVIVAVMLYGLVGNHLPWIFEHSGYGIEELIARQTVSMSGVYAFILQIMATWVAIFLLLAGLVEEYGGFDYITESGMKIARRSKSGLVQTAVVSSMIVGMMMGAAVSNVAITGSFTIPLMKDRGVPASVAGAIESVASTGGQILPPIMGLAAFLMADIVGIPFSEVVIGGFLPAMLFYITIGLGIHFRTKKEEWIDDVPEGDGVSWGFLLRGAQYIIPIVVLIYVLIALEFGPLEAGKYTLGTLLLTTVVRYGVIDRDLRGWVEDTINGLIRGGEMLAPFMALGAGLGIIINIYGSTGLGQKIALNLMVMAAGVMVVALLIVMFVSILFGMGMPTPAAYILVATVLAPALVRLGFEPLVSHMYVFYFALLSSLTPPVAVPIAMATTISGSGFWETVVEALRFGVWLFFIPFMFLANPALIIWSFPETVLQFVLVSSGCVGLVFTSTGYNGFAELGSPGRSIAFILGIVTIFAPDTIIQIGGLICMLVFITLSVLGSRSEHLQIAG
ncbi:TRAP transporter permease [Halobellus captivus]|uniref:TRAP transporter permease n=1 Tax=Halobellus captivus TaxID=2592614 RepID=UPI00119FE55D|nr:TRAP transporter fused permease subunit [Halobellus captivus]